MSAGQESSRLATVTARAFQETGGWLLLGLGLLGARNAISVVADGMVVAMVVFLFSMLLVLAGAVIAPSVRKRVDNHHSLTAFGRTPVVEQRAVRPEENCIERCVVCDSFIEAGLVRRYREDIAVAGIPLVFGSNSHNYYCLECARKEMGVGLEQSTAGEGTNAAGGDHDPEAEATDRRGREVATDSS